MAQHQQSLKPMGLGATQVLGRFRTASAIPSKR